MFLLVKIHVWLVQSQHQFLIWLYTFFSFWILDLIVENTLIGSLVYCSSRRQFLNFLFTFNRLIFQEFLSLAVLLLKDFLLELLDFWLFWLTIFKEFTDCLVDFYLESSLAWTFFFWSRFRVSILVLFFRGVLFYFEETFFLEYFDCLVY